jgi:dihydrofolate reductase
MKCSVFIATSADGYIATRAGDVDWLESAGNPAADMGERSDMGFREYMASIDCIIMGRKSMEKIASFNLTPEQWPYGDIRIIVLSNTLTEAPESLESRMEIYSGDIPALISRLQSEGYQHAYIDGGMTITSFLNLKLIDEMTITQSPILLGEGIALFGRMNTPIRLLNTRADVYPNDFIQIRYDVGYQ